MIGVTTRIVFNVFNGILIINNEGTVIGFITTIDILYAIKDGRDINNNTIGDTMTVNPTLIKQNKNNWNLFKIGYIKRNFKRKICSHRYKKPTTTTITIKGEG